MNIAICASAYGLCAGYVVSWVLQIRVPNKYFVVMFVLQVHWSILTPGLQSSFKQVKHNVHRYLNRRDRFKIIFVLVKSSNFVKSVQALL